ncbi:MAG: response regulator transcription factor [Oscillospiraceae bacterium]|nr:response regulator transcription factor [Oscillospiraceae bacterium]
MKILICDDDRDIVSALKIYLSAEGYDILIAHDGAEAVDTVRNEDVQLVLLDIMMPRLDGLSATAAIRAEKNIPIILLTAKSEDTDKVVGLTVGADDYVTKPFNPVELCARVKSQLRRYTLLGGMQKSPDRLENGGVSLDDAAKSVTVDGEPVSLTPTEYAILKLLMSEPGRVFSSGTIYERVSGGSPIGSEGAVAVHIRHLREKLEINPSEPRYIKVVWGQGYKFVGGAV